MTARTPWTRIDGGRSKTSAVYRHEPTGWLIRHCGHPTANWPYYLVDPAHPAAATMTHNGLGFRRVVDAQQAVDDVLAGRKVATASRCAPGVRRVTTHDDDCELAESTP